MRAVAAPCVAQAHAPEHVVPGGLPTETLIAQVIVAKFGDHLPFYRQADIYARQGIALDRATLGNWAGRACFHLQPIAITCPNAWPWRTASSWMRRRLLFWIRAHRTKKALLGHGSDDRGHGGPSPPVVLFRYAPGRSGAYAEQFLRDYMGDSCNAML